MSLKHNLGKSVGYIVFKAVCSGMEVASKHDGMVQSEIKAFPENITVGFSTGRGHKSACVKVEDGQFKLIKYSFKEFKPDILISFKSLKSAFKVMLAQQSVKGAYLNYRIFYEGDLMLAARIIRIIDRVESYLFPDFLMEKILDSSPVRETGRAKIYAGVIARLIKGGEQHGN